MEPPISPITLGVSDPGKATRFCEKYLGLPRLETPPSITFFEPGKTWLALGSRESRAADAGLSAEGSGFRGFGLAHNVRPPASIDKPEVHMPVSSHGRNALLAGLIAFAAQLWTMGQPLAQTQSVSIVIVRHAEADTSQATVPLTATGRQRADLLASTFRGVRFTHLFATHTTRTRQMVEALAAAQGLQIVQLPVPGSILDRQPVTDQTSRRAPIEPIATALLELPPGSVALAVLNSENIFAILNRLGVPVASAGQSCAPGATCVPCLDNTCFPPDHDRMWHLVREPGRAGPLTFMELRYGVGWRAPDR